MSGDSCGGPDSREHRKRVADLFRRERDGLIEYARKAFPDLDRPHIEDVVHHVFWKVLEGEIFLPAENDGVLGALRQAVWNYGRDRRRREKVRQAEPLVRGEDRNSPDSRGSWSAAELAELRSDLKAALEVLTERERVVFMKSASEGLTYGEIARSLNCSQRTVARVYASAKSKMRSALKWDWGE